MNPEKKIRRRIKIMLTLFIIGLMGAGLTTFPLEWEMGIVQKLFGEGGPLAMAFPPLTKFLRGVVPIVTDISENYPVVFYAFDWLGFAHIVIAIAFIGPWRDPLRNIWVIEFGMIACVLVIPAVLILAPIRGLPVHWWFIDMSFGVLGFLPLWFVRRDIKKLENHLQNLPI